MKLALNILAAFAILSAVAPLRTLADEKTPATPAAPAKAKAKYLPLYAQVDSITDTLLTVKGAADTKYVINAETKISQDKAGKTPAKVTDVKVGQWIGGSYIKAEDGTLTLHSLHLGVSQKGTKTKQ